MKSFNFFKSFFAAVICLSLASFTFAASPGTVILGKTSVTLDANRISKAIVLSLQNSENCDFKIVISDRENKILKEDVISKGATFKKRYDLSKLPSGIYLLTFKNADKETVLPIYINGDSLGMEKKGRPNTFAAVIPAEVRMVKV